MQCAVIEFARNVLDFKDAHTTEIIEKTPSSYQLNGRTKENI